MHQSRTARAYHTRVNLQCGQTVFGDDVSLCLSNVDNALVLYLRIDLQMGGIGEMMKKDAGSNTMIYSGSVNERLLWGQEMRCESHRLC